MGQAPSSRARDVEVVFLDEDWLHDHEDDKEDGEQGSFEKSKSPRSVRARKKLADGSETYSVVQFRDYSLNFWSRVLGKGSFATVKLATHHTTGHQVAVKVIKRQARGKAGEKADATEGDEEALMQREVKHQNLLRHPNVVRLHTWVITPKEFLLVMEYCPKGDVLCYINERQQLHTGESRYFFEHLLEGVTFCHSLGICHRDLKLENLLLCPTVAGNGAGTPASVGSSDGSLLRPWEAWTLKIADFGLSDLNPIGILSTHYCGSPIYAAPELVGIGQRNGFDASKSDMWSCGVILYAFLTSRMPFDGDDMKMLFTKITRVQYDPIPATDAALRAASELVAQLLERNPTTRLSARAALASPWMRSVETEAIHAGLPSARRSGSLNLIPQTWAASAQPSRAEELESHSLPSRCSPIPARLLAARSEGGDPLATPSSIDLISSGKGISAVDLISAKAMPPRVGSRESMPQLPVANSPPGCSAQLPRDASVEVSASVASAQSGSSKRTASATSSYFHDFYQQLCAQADATTQLAQSFFGLTEADLQAIQADATVASEEAAENGEESYNQFLSVVDAAHNM